MRDALNAKCASSHAASKPLDCLQPVDSRHLQQVSSLSFGPVYPASQAWFCTSCWLAACPLMRTTCPHCLQRWPAVRQPEAGLARWRRGCLLLGAKCTVLFRHGSKAHCHCSKCNFGVPRPPAGPYSVVTCSSPAVLLSCYIQFPSGRGRSVRGAALARAQCCGASSRHAQPRPCSQVLRGGGGSQPCG